MVFNPTGEFPTGYAKFKTPFFRVSVGDPTGKNMIQLPMQIHKLINSVEIHEALDSRCGVNQITVTFSEGSREPFPTDSTAVTAPLYGIEGGNDSDGLTNAAALISDLRFSGGAGSGGNIGITSINSVVAAQATAAVNKSVIDPTLGTPDNITLKQQFTDLSAPRYLFNENNRLEVTWGYIEDPKNQRTVAAHVQIFTFNFPEAGATKAQVIAVGTAQHLNKIAATKGIKFSNELPIGFDAKHQRFIKIDKDQPTKQIVETIALRFKMEAIVSNKFVAETMDGDHAKLCPAGMSIHQFLAKLAQRHHAYYKILVNPKTRKDVLIFINAVEYNKIFSFDPDLLTYRGKGSILKSISMRADFGGVSGHTGKAWNKKGESQTIGGNVAFQQFTAFDGQQLATNDPTDPQGNAVAQQQSQAENGEISGAVQVDPEVDSPKNLEEKSAAMVACRNSRMIVVEFTTLGHTKLHPGPIPLNGLGLRYSGVYKIEKVTHVLDSNGYNCKCVARTMGINGGGISADDAGAIKGNNSDTTDVIQFESAASVQDVQDNLLAAAGDSLGGGNAKQKYEQTFGLA